MRGHADAFRGDNLFGEILDISLQGASLLLNGRPDLGTPVSVLLDPRPLTREGESGPASFKASVTWSTRGGASADGTATWRVGLTFAVLPRETCMRLTRAVPVIARGTETLRTPAQLASSPVGREVLYQHALERLVAGDPASARELASQALAVIPRARHLRALVCRCNAEEALAHRRDEIARREVSYALRLAPNDPDICALSARLTVEPTVTPTRGVIARLFSSGKSGAGRS